MTAAVGAIDARRRTRVWLFWSMVAGAALCTASASPLSAQRVETTTASAAANAWTFSGDVAAVLGGTWLTSTTAPTVKTAAGVSLAVGAQRHLSDRVRAGLALRVQSQPVRLRESGFAWDGGTLTVGDVMGTLVLPAIRTDGVASDLEISGGLSVLTGARELYPFSSAKAVTPAVGIGAVVSRAARRNAAPTRAPLSIIVRYDLIRLDPGPTLASSLDSFAGSAGWSPRISAGLRVHR